ncbi:MAG: electron transfer flavoprotein subunit alpha/FixB family protein, partial [Candidatus Berkiella sp.]
MAKVLVIAEHHADQLAPSTKATISAALALTSLCDVFVACDKDEISQDIAKLQGVANVLVATHERFAHVLAEDLAPLLMKMANDYTHILAPSTTFGKNMMPRLAAMLDVGQISDVCTIEKEDVFIRPIYAGNAFEKVQALDNIKILTIRTTAFDMVQTGGQGKITKLECSLEKSTQIEFISQATPTLTRPELTSAKIVISGGRGLKSSENFKMIENLADKLGAAVGASRAAVDAGFVSNDFQVGQTGKVVAPSLYIAVGISGAIQHLAGMKDSKVIVAINKDSDAPIFQIADYGLVGDLFTILPE